MAPPGRLEASAGGVLMGAKPLPEGFTAAETRAASADSRREPNRGAYGSAVATPVIGLELLRPFSAAGSGAHGRLDKLMGSDAEGR